MSAGHSGGWAGEGVVPAGRGRVAVSSPEPPHAAAVAPFQADTGAPSTSHARMLLVNLLNKQLYTALIPYVKSIIKLVIYFTFNFCFNAFTFIILFSTTIMCLVCFECHEITLYLQNFIGIKKWIIFIIVHCLQAGIGWAVIWGNFSQEMKILYLYNNT